jgi:hypothetical protein
MITRFAAVSSQLRLGIEESGAGSFPAAIHRRVVSVLTLTISWSSRR